MSFIVRLISAFPVYVLSALLGAPPRAEAQNPSQVHPITALPLPEDEGTSPAAKPAAAPGAGAKHKPETKPAPKPRHGQKPKHEPKLAKKTAKKHEAAPETPTPAAPAVAPAPAPESAPVAAPEASAPTPKPLAHKGHLSKAEQKRARKAAKLAVKPATASQKIPREPTHEPAAPVDNTVHAIHLAPPPDEEPEFNKPAPKVEIKPEPKPEPIKSQPKPEPKIEEPKPAPAPKHGAVKPVPVTKPAVIPTPEPAVVKPEPKPELPKPVEVKPAPKPVEVKPVPKVETPKLIEVKPEPKPEAPKPVEAKPVPKVETPKVEVPKPAITKPIEIAPKPIETAPKPEPKHETSKPVEPKPEAPKPAVTKPSEVVTKPTDTAPKPQPAEVNPPTRRPPVAPVTVPATPPTSSNIPAAKSVVVPSSVVPDEPPPAPVTAPAKPVKPAPALKPRANSPSIVNMPSSVGVSPTAPNSKPAVTESAPEAAPTPPLPPPGTLSHIVFIGSAPFTESELSPLTGLTLGDKPTSESLQTASNRLIETGLFTNVKVSYDTPNNVGTATFTVEPLPVSQLARASFANLVWLTPAEIEETLKLLPLYRGVIPMAGNIAMADSIQAALQSALSARGVQATLTHVLIPPSPQHPFPAVEFRVTSPNVVLASASLFDIPPALVNRTLKAQTDAQKVPYNEGIAGTTLSDILLAPARDAGYIGARLWHIERKRHALGRGTVAVDFVARMDPGPVYTVRAVTWEPTTVLTESQFRHLAPLHVGQVPTTDAVNRTQQVITDAYYAQGYLEANINAKQELDTKTGAAYYTYAAIAGPQYRVNSISVQGLSPEARQDFDAAWTIKPGDVYNEGYLLNFLATHQNVQSFKGYTFTYDRSTSPDTHKVDLTLTFHK